MFYVLAYWGRLHQRFWHTSLGAKDQVLHPHKMAGNFVLERHLSL